MSVVLTNTFSTMLALVANLLVLKTYEKAYILGGASQLKDEPWATFTCKLGWPVQGVFPSGTDGSHINGVDRSKAKDLIATGDDWGLVNIYRNPCLTGAKPNSYKGHSEHVVRVRFDKSDTRLYSIGGYDRTLMQWRVTK